jgi:hypothetical protein
MCVGCQCLNVACVLCLSVVTAPAWAPREVSSVCQDHHFSIEALDQLSKWYKRPIVLCVGEGICHGGGMYPMEASRSTYIVCEQNMRHQGDVGDGLEWRKSSK